MDKLVAVLANLTKGIARLTIAVGDLQEEVKSLHDSIQTPKSVIVENFRSPVSGRNIYE